MKKTVLIKVAYLVELTEEEIDNDDIDSVLDKIISKISKDRTILANDKNFDLEWNSTSPIVLDSNDMNCGRCAKCGGWVTDRERDNPILELCNGATVDDKLLCDECLPSEHRWAF